MKRNKLIISITTLAGAAILTAFFVVALVAYNSLMLGQLYYAKGLVVYIVIYLGLLITVTKMYGGYEIGTYRIFEVAFSQILSIVFVNMISYLQISLIAKGFLQVNYMIALTAAQFVFAVLWAILSNKVYYRIFSSSHMLLIYGKDYPTPLIEKIKMNRQKYHLSKILTEGELSVCGHRSALEGFQGIMIHQVKPELASSIKEYCFERNLRLYIVPEISDILTNHADQIELSDTPLLLCSNESLSLAQETLKRMLDLVVSIPILLIASPFMLATVIAIKLHDGGPAIYKQERLTRGGKTFMVYKFRSMIIEAERDGVAKLSNKGDDRITPIGGFLRKIRFDEIPQFFNVLMGDMSVVGPRPERQSIAAAYEELLPEFANRLKMKAGITGYAQVYGKYNTSPKDKLIMDIIYINNYSVLFDLKLILLTIKIVFLPGKTEGV